MQSFINGKSIQTLQVHVCDFAVFCGSFKDFFFIFHVLQMPFFVFTLFATEFLSFHFVRRNLSPRTYFNWSQQCCFFSHSLMSLAKLYVEKKLFATKGNNMCNRKVCPWIERIYRKKALQDIEQLTL